MKKSKRKSENTSRQMKMETLHSRTYGCSKSNSKGMFIVIQAFLKKQEKSQVNNLIYHLKELAKEEQTRPKVSRSKEIIKIREEISKIETKKKKKKKK